MREAGASGVRERLRDTSTGAEDSQAGVRPFHTLRGACEILALGAGVRRWADAAPAANEAVRSGLGCWLIFRSAADAGGTAGRRHTLAIDGSPSRRALWLARRSAVVPGDTAALLISAVATTAT